MQERNEWKIFAAAGFGSGITNHDLNFPIKFIVQKNEHAIISRAQTCFDLGIGPKSPEIRLRELAVLYAYNTSPYSDIGNTYFTFGAGVGFISGIARGSLINSGNGLFGRYENYEEVQTSNGGMALEISVIKPASDWFGIGASMFANINAKYPIYAYNLILYFGKL